MGPPWLGLLHYSLQEERERGGEHPQCGTEDQLELLPWGAHCLKLTPRGPFVPSLCVYQQDFSVHLPYTNLCPRWPECRTMTI